MDGCTLPTNQRPGGTKGQHTLHATANNAPPAQVAAPFVACQVIASEQKTTGKGSKKNLLFAFFYARHWGTSGLITRANQHSCMLQTGRHCHQHNGGMHTCTLACDVFQTQKQAVTNDNAKI